MRQTNLFTKTRKEAPKDEIARNAQLLTRAGFVHKEMAGVYAYLPLGLRVLNKIVAIIREEMNAIGGQEMSLTALQNPELWQKTGRFSDAAIDVWFKTELANGSEVGIANTHEEPMTNLVSHFVNSYRDLPLYTYQFQTKFRNELRAKSGIMRAREFLMKDLYSFSRSEEEFKEFYEKCAAAYMRIFERVGIGHLTYRTHASGGAFSDFSDEFQTLTEAGEDLIYVDTEKNIAVNKEVFTDEALAALGLERGKLEERKAVEVGNIFPLGTKYSKALGLTFKDEQGQERPVIMGSYGIGPGRVMGAVVEIFADEKGMVWPEAIAPFKAHLVLVPDETGEARKRADAVYEALQKEGVEVLYDDRDERAGEKFADADLIGIPWRLVVSGKTGEKVEIKRRASTETTIVEVDEAIRQVRGSVNV